MDSLATIVNSFQPLTIAAKIPAILDVFGVIAAPLISQGPIYRVNSPEVLKLKSKIKTEKEERYKNISQKIEESFIKDQNRLMKWCKMVLISQSRNFGKA